MYEDRLTAEFASTDPETQSAAHSWFVRRICMISLFGVATNLVYTAARSIRIRSLAKDIVKETFARVVQAPVNLFFDVTPLGKVLKVFNSEINRFS